MKRLLPALMLAFTLASGTVISVSQTIHTATTDNYNKSAATCTITDETPRTGSITLDDNNNVISKSSDKLIEDNPMTRTYEILPGKRYFSGIPSLSHVTPGELKVHNRKPSTIWNIHLNTCG